MGKRKRTDTQILRDKALVSSMLLKGNDTVSEIQLEINKVRPYSISASQVRYDIKKIKEEWIIAKLDDYDQARAREIAKIDKLERTYWEAWSHSLQTKTDKVLKDTEQEGTGNYEGEQVFTSEQLKVIEGRGDKDFLKGVQWCIEQRCKIKGLDAPSQIDVTWREKAEKHGIPKHKADSMKTELVKQFVDAAQK